MLSNGVVVAELVSVSDIEYAQLNSLIIKTWDYNLWLERDEVSPMSEYLLNDIILSSSKIYVARKDGFIIGVIAASLKRNCLYDSKFRLKQLSAMLALIDDESAFGEYIKTMRINEILLQKSNQSYDASLNFFAIDSHYRGCGLGNVLFDTFISYLASNKVKKYFLFTDSSSNYIFYERKGLNKMAMERFFWKDNGEVDEVEEYYLYEGLVY